MVSVIADVGGQVGAVTPTLDDLLAVIGSTPIHLHTELISFDEPRRIAQPLAHLSQEKHEAVSPGTVAGESRISLNLQPPANGPFHQSPCRGSIPALRQPPPRPE